MIDYMAVINCNLCEGMTAYPHGLGRMFWQGWGGFSWV